MSEVVLMAEAKRSGPAIADSWWKVIVSVAPEWECKYMGILRELKRAVLGKV